MSVTWQLGTLKTIGEGQQNQKHWSLSNLKLVKISFSPPPALSHPVSGAQATTCCRRLKLLLALHGTSAVSCIARSRKDFLFNVLLPFFSFFGCCGGFLGFERSNSHLLYCSMVSVRYPHETVSFVPPYVLFLSVLLTHMCWRLNWCIPRLGWICWRSGRLGRIVFSSNKSSWQVFEKEKHHWPLGHWRGLQDTAVSKASGSCLAVTSHMAAWGLDSSGLFVGSLGFGKVGPFSNLR